MKTLTAVSAGAAALAGYAFLARPWFLHWGTTREERLKIWPGDELAGRARTASMRAISIDALPWQVWPWIVQIGQDRAGFYSYRELENAAGAHMPKVEQLVPQFQHRFAGDTVWLAEPHTYGGKAKVIVGLLERDRAMILVSPEDWERVRVGKPISGGTWGFILEPAADGKTRLVMRSVTSVPPFSRAALAGYAWELPHFIMERRMMVHLKALVERNSPRVRLERVEIAVEPA